VRRRPHTLRTGLLPCLLLRLTLCFTSWQMQGRKRTETRLVYTQSEKHQVIFNHFLQHIGSYDPRSCTLNWSSLDRQTRDLQHLENPVSEGELKQVIQSTPKEKAPGPDGFIGLFFSTCWDIIQVDLVQAVDHFFSLNQQGSLLQTSIVSMGHKPLWLRASGPSLILRHYSGSTVTTGRSYSSLLWSVAVTSTVMTAAHHYCDL
jgi:hypothetical protein